MALRVSIIIGLAAAAAAAVLVGLYVRSRTATPGPLTRISLSVSRDNSLTIDGGTTISPDGRTVAFVARNARLIYSVGQDNYNISWTSADGTGKPERLTQSQRPQNPTGVSPDGDKILFNQVEPATGSDVWELSLSRRESHPLVETSFNEGNAVFSDDGRWIEKADTNQSSQLNIVENWFEELRARVPVR